MQGERTVKVNGKRMLPSLLQWPIGFLINILTLITPTTPFASVCIPTAIVAQERLYLFHRRLRCHSWKCL